MGAVHKWLEDVGLGEYAELFAEQRIDFDVLTELTGEDLALLGITALGDRKRLLREISKLERSAADAAPVRGEASSPPVAPEAHEPERRQLTVLFCDLVGSTQLSGQLDPEDLRTVIRRYQDAVARASARFGGYVAKYLGDGVLVYFGWPRAQEDQAERAVWAGLEAIRRAAQIEGFGGSRLEARVGIASGQVVVGDLVGDAGRDTDAVVGPTPNLAARLQGLAAPGQVAIDGETCGLVGKVFELEMHGNHAIKGFSSPVPVWQVIGEGEAESRFEAMHAGRLAPFVGRRHELGLMKERWLQATDGKGQIVLLTAEPGMGKSRMVSALCDSIGEAPYTRLRYQCSPYHTGSALYPVIQQLKHAAGFVTGDDQDTCLDKLETLLHGTGSSVADSAPLLADLMSLQGEARYGPLKHSPGQKRKRTIAALIEQFLSLSRQSTVLLVLEDAQWIDPTTEALMGEVMLRTADSSALVLVTYRPEYNPPWAVLSNMVRLSLSGLPDQQCADMVRAISGDIFPQQAVSEIVARAEGVPLYVEELTESLLKSGDSAAEIPKSLQASLLERLDRLGEAGQVAQLAAALGRSFHYRFLKEAGRFEDAALLRSIAEIREAGLLLQRGEPPESVYTFRHALIHDAAYATLLKGKRQRFHGRAAEVLLRDFPEEAEASPEVVARHLSFAGLPERSADYWLRAGQRAGERSAHFEAIANLEKGLQELEHLPKSKARDESEFEIRVALGASLLPVKGWSAAEVERNYIRAREIGDRTNDVQKTLAVSRGLANVYFLRGAITDARVLADRELAVAMEHDDRSLLLGGFRSVGMCSLFAGEFAAARESLARANDLYDRQLHHAQAFMHGTDPGVIGLSASAWASWFLGDLRQSVRESDSALTLAEALQHPFSLCYARCVVGSVQQASRDPASVHDTASAALAVAQEQLYPYWIGWATVLQGWATAALGEPEEGIDLLREGLEVYEGTGARLIKPYILTLHAEMCAWAGQPQAGLTLLEEAQAPGNRNDVGFYDAEILRVRGELLCQSQSGDGQDSFRRAGDIARGQGARSLELRAALSAARALIADGREASARDLIATACAPFAVDLSGRDLDEARSLLTGHRLINC